MIGSDNTAYNSTSEDVSQKENYLSKDKKIASLISKNIWRLASNGTQSGTTANDQPQNEDATSSIQSSIKKMLANTYDSDTFNSDYSPTFDVDETRYKDGYENNYKNEYANEDSYGGVFSMIDRFMNNPNLVQKIVEDDLLKINPDEDSFFKKYLVTKNIIVICALALVVVGVVVSISIWRSRKNKKLNRSNAVRRASVNYQQVQEQELANLKDKTEPKDQIEV